jgi:hypothetical protein
MTALQPKQIKSDLQVVSSNSNQMFSSKSEIKKGMTTEQIADILSDYLISHVNKVFEKLKK